MSTDIESRALTLLGSGVQQEAVANALGVTPSYISQLLSNENFAANVAQLRYENLSKHTARDSKYDELEDDLIEKLEHALPLMLRPRDILSAIKVINSAKRRGLDSPDGSVTQQQLVQISMPTTVVQNFTTNVNNQVVQAGDQSLLTIPSSDLKKLSSKETNPNEEATIKDVNEVPTVEEDSLLASL